MTQLEKLYQSIQNLKELGVQLPEKLIEETNRVEEEIIKNEIVPALANTITPVISQIQREIILVIEYVPDEPLSVKLTRKRNLTIPTELSLQTTVTDKIQKAFTEKETYTVASHTKSSKTILRVIFTDGKVISHRFAYDTLVDTIKNIGYAKVENLNIICCGVPLVSNKKDDYYTQHELTKNVLIMTHSSTRSKKEQLDEISKRLGLGLKVEIV